MRILPSMLLVFAVAFLAGCGKTGSVASSKPKIIVTFSVLADWTRNIAGEHYEVVSLVGPDGDAHTFEPTPQDLLMLSDAKLIIANGAGFEPWLDKPMQSSQTSARRVNVSEGMTLLTGGCECCKHKKGEEHAHTHDEETDPHVWHEVGNAKFAIAKIRDALIQLDPDHGEVFQSNAAAYLTKLDALDRWILAEVATLPRDKRKLVTSHDTFGYFAKRYEFDVIGTAIGSFTTEAADPSAAEFAKLLRTIRDAKVKAIFCETMHNPKLMQRLASEAKVILAPALYTDALGPDGSPGATYEGMMRHNVATIVVGLLP
jgi:zinc/manganese transport system substrate-binding protein